MRNPFIISAFIVILLLTFSCSKDKLDQIDTKQLWDCYKSQNYDSTKDFENFELDLNKPSTYFYGRILLCENQVLFNNSYIDGSDNLFVRTDY